VNIVDGWRKKEYAYDEQILSECFRAIVEVPDLESGGSEAI
jgi:hypothetical protein